MTQIGYLTPTGPQPDRRTRLLVMGILLLAMAGLCALMLLLMGVAVAVAARGGVAGATGRQVIPGIVMYLGMAAVFTWLGLGSIARKRWVRPAVLAIAWNWLIVGTGGMVAAVWVVVHMQGAFSASASPAMRSGAFSAFIITFTVAISAVFYVGLPLMLILAYKSPDVQATLDFYDPNRRWTDGVPIRVLGLCAFMLMAVVGLLSNVFMAVAPMFGVLLTGPAAVVSFALVAAVFCLAAWWCYRLQRRGWWLALALFILMPISGAMTFMRISMTDMYKAMGMSDAEVEMVQNTYGMRPRQMMVWIVIGGLLGIGYVLVARSSFFERRTLARADSIERQPVQSLPVQDTI